MLLALLLAATVRGPGGVESMTAAADAVVHGRVVRRTSAWGEGGGQIFTTVTLAPLETWKGAAEGEIRMLVPGGAVGDFAQTVQGSATFDDQEEVVVFLRQRAPGLFTVRSLALGKFTVTAKRAVRDRRGLVCVGCGAAERDDLPLEELRVHVLASVHR